MRETNRLVQFFGPYLQYAVMLLLMLLLLSASRIGLFIWQFDRVDAAGNIGYMLLQGVRADLIFAGLWLILPVLLAPLLAGKKQFMLWRRFSHIWVLLGFCLVIFIEVSTPQFILQYDIRPNRLYVEYLKYPKEVFSTLWQGYRSMLLGGIAVTALLLWGLHDVFSRVTAATQPYTGKILWLPGLWWHCWYSLPCAPVLNTGPLTRRCLLLPAMRWLTHSLLIRHTQCYMHFTI